MFNNYTPINEYAIIDNGRTAALISKKDLLTGFAGPDSTAHHFLLHFLTKTPAATGALNLPISKALDEIITRIPMYLTLSSQQTLVNVY
jgi:hypothetical protein